MILHLALVAVALAFGAPASAHLTEPAVSIQHETMPVMARLDPQLIACCDDEAPSDSSPAESSPICHTACPGMAGCGFSMVLTDTRFETLSADRQAFHSSTDNIVGIAILPPTPPPKAQV
jgi:hypothetical protein